jgi:mono-ADP-ribosyltransferase sirtuin 6
MSEGYNSRLSKKVYKGICGDEEKYDSPGQLRKKIDKLVSMCRASNYTVAHTGAGVSTSCGIPDFRGPTGVWTAEEKGVPPPPSAPFESAIPSLTHMALLGLMRANRLRYVISQNVDGLHLRSGIPRTHISELHGNIFAEECTKCRREYMRTFDTQGMGLKPTGRYCTLDGCGGALKDRVCDWTSILPPDEFDRAVHHHRQAELAICLGTSLRIRPAGSNRKIRKKITKMLLIICMLRYSTLSKNFKLSFQVICLFGQFGKMENLSRAS